MLRAIFFLAKKEWGKADDLSIQAAAPYERVEIPERWKMSWRRPRNAQYPIFRSTRVVSSRSNPGDICIFGKGLFAFRRQMQMKGFFQDERMQRNRGFARLGPFANSFHRQQLTFSSPMCMMHLSRKQYPAISLSNSLVIRRGHCAFDLLSLSPSLPLFPSSFLSRNFILHSCGVVTPSLPPFAILSAHENRMTRAKTSRGRSSRSMSFLQDGCTLRGDLTCARGETRTYDMDTYVASTSYIFSLERWFTFCLENSFIDFRNDFRKRIEEIIIREGY